MTKKKFYLGLILGLCVLNLVLVTFLVLGRPHHPAGHEMKGPKEFITKALHFNKKQTANFLKLVEGHQVAIRSRTKKIDDLKGKLYNTLINSQITIEKDSLLKEISKYQLEIENLHYKHFQDIKKLCRADQMEYYNDLTFQMVGFFNKIPRPRR